MDSTSSGSVATRALLEPGQMGAVPSGASRSFLVALLFVLTVGCLFTAHPPMHPLVLALVAILFWTAAVSVLAVGSAMIGPTISWIEAARLVSAAGWPLVLKFALADVVTACTSFSVFAFSASPTLFWAKAPAALARVDLFEIWALVLLVMFLSRRPGATRAKSVGLALLVWGAELLFLYGARAFAEGMARS